MRPITRVQLAIMAGLRDLGMAYEFGAKPPLEGDRTPAMRTDCSGAVRRWVAQAGVSHIRRPDGRTITVNAWNGSVVQYESLRAVPVAVALGANGIGLFLFIPPRGSIPGHVALSLGHGYTLEARGSEGVCIVRPSENRSRGWDRAAKMDELYISAVLG